ncbi:unnamed protein product [Miscanthus lutarioriparius]|uniref:SWIM-type domain-containing protein n=1 Tax=Miscanthus lutarioriparius TaxID=422564 RepID=A0A811MIS2_9POAL|nr:unnamed protein product [Miscanthus lutarioriparius]
MAGVRRLEGAPAPDYGPDEEFSVEVHHGGFFCGSVKDQVYLDGKVDWFDNCKVQHWRFSSIQEISVMLGYGIEKLTVLWLLPEMVVSSGLRIIDSDAETLIIKQVAYHVNNFVLYFDIYKSFKTSDWDDNVVNPGKPAAERHDDDDGDFVASDDDGSVDGDFVDSDYEVDHEDDDFFWDNVDDGVVDEGAGMGIVVSKGYKRNAPVGKENMAERQWDEISTDEDELELPDSNGEGKVGANMSSFRPEDIENPIFKLGMKFDSIELLRKAISEYSIKERVEIKMPWNDKKRIKAHCDKKWELKRCTAKWPANKYLDRFRADEKMSLTNFGKTVQLELNLTISRMKLCRARRKAWEIIYGDEVKQFNELRNYGHELRRTNPGSTFFLTCLDGFFSTLYMSMDACKRGFLTGCRPVICLDGCHIKTKFGGQLLTAIGIDPNDCIFPLAIAVVEVECLTSWKWFLETLKEDLGIENTTPWTIMTEKTKGLIPLVQISVSRVEHGLHVEHLCTITSQANSEERTSRISFGGVQELNTVVRWNQEMDKMRVLKEGCPCMVRKDATKHMAKKCECRRWDLIGIPCSHAIACLKHERILEDSVLPHCYSIEAFQNAYNFQIFSCSDKTNWQNVGGTEVKPPKYEKKLGRPSKARKKAPHEQQGRNGPRLSKHGVTMHCSHCGKPDHNVARCAAKEAGEPAVQKRKRSAVQQAHEEARHQEEYQEVYTAEAETEATMSQVDNPMLSQLLDEASQTMRQHPVSQPVPDSAYIVSNVPPARQIQMTTATKAGRTSRTKKAANQKKRQ